MWRELPKEFYRDYAAAKSLIKMADNALAGEKYPEFRQHVFGLTHVMKRVDHDYNKDFKGTGIG